MAELREKVARAIQEADDPGNRRGWLWEVYLPQADAAIEAVLADVTEALRSNPLPTNRRGLSPADFLEERFGKSGPSRD